MKTIQEVSIWDNGKNEKGTILNAYAVSVNLNTSATFWYGIFSTTEEGNVGQQLTQGNLSMTGEAYEDWAQDSYAWDWIAGQLNLTITGDYIIPVKETTTVNTSEPEGQSSVEIIEEDSTISE
jgi:hypothetical protein